MYTTRSKYESLITAIGFVFTFPQFLHTGDTQLKHYYKPNFIKKVAEECVSSPDCCWKIWH